MAHSIDFGDGVLDLRDIVERLTELRELRDEEGEPGEVLVGLDDDEADELAELEAFAEAFNTDTGSDIEGYAENEPTLIDDDRFEQYAQQFADDIGAIDANASWPLNRIDWEAAADDLKEDYSSIDFDGRTFWIRSY